MKLAEPGAWCQPTCITVSPNLPQAFLTLSPKHKISDFIKDIKVAIKRSLGRDPSEEELANEIADKPLRVVAPKKEEQQQQNGKN